ncbi:MAG TPA: 50S ribosomal protein L35 [bacterium]|jgi:large subunit ribosomal protein L35|nr:50S ribosomal protein L35 [bacterium]HOY43386.1 50S ribosomal protein L35 [bacterium]HPG84466.1 50S ribosomal protein L35 [bacterium]
MPKMKSNRAAKKRFSLTGTGKVRRNKNYARHILTKKSAKRKRSLRQNAIATPADEPRIKRMLSA